MPISVRIAIAILSIGLYLPAGCSDDTTASEQKSTTQVADKQTKTDTQTFTELTALTARDRTAEQDVQLAGFYAEMGHKEDAFGRLSDAAVKGYSDLSKLQSDPKLANLRADERWHQVELFVDVNGGNHPMPTQTAPQTVQRPPTQSAKVNIPAPDWTLLDVSGKPVHLKDLRGKTIIMDFWATWCGPCKKSMPEIDKFTREYASDDLLVFSVNVWERSPDVALEWWNQQGYVMKLLFGDRNLTTAYEVQGIPHLCLIDADGIIRYSQPGFHPQVLDYIRKLAESDRAKG